MMTGAFGRRLLRFAAAAALAGLAAGCASSQGPNTTVAPPGYGNDAGSRVERLVQYCDRLTEKGELVTALGLCARAHEMDPDNPEPMMKVASILQKMNRQQAAVATYDAVLQRHPKHHEAQYRLAKLYMEAGETDLAAVHFNHALSSDPADPRPYNALGILRDQAGEHTAAQGFYRQALERDPTNMSVRNNLGLSLALDGKRDAAIEVLAELAVEPQAGQTVMRNLEAAYAARTMPAGDGAKGTTAAMPAPASMDPASMDVDADPVEPVSGAPLDMPAAKSQPQPDAAPTASKKPAEGPVPASPEAGAPTPLFLPPSSNSSDRQQSGALVPAPVPAGTEGSAILAAAARLMQPPEWADFEPGALITEDVAPPRPALPPVEPAVEPVVESALEPAVDVVPVVDAAPVAEIAPAAADPVAPVVAAPAVPAATVAPAAAVLVPSAAAEPVVPELEPAPEMPAAAPELSPEDDGVRKLHIDPLQFRA